LYALNVSDTDLIKIDLGVQINGYIADTAVTVNYDPQYDSLVQAAEDALQNAMSMIKVGVKSKDVGRKIQTTIMDAGLKPIANLSGHSLDQYTIHAGKTVHLIALTDITNERLRNLKDIDAFIQVACPRISTDNRFDKPVLSTPQAVALMKLLRKENIENYFQIKHWL